MDIAWEEGVDIKFQQMIEKIPPVLRSIAKSKVSQKAKTLAEEAQHTKITEKDMVDAFFLETPFGFHGPMKVDMESLSIDYTQYGYEH